jgi:hypothetical protein
VHRSTRTAGARACCSAAFHCRILFVSDRDFFFTLDVSGDSTDDQMMADLARTVLGHVGYANSAIAALTGELRGALADRVAEGRRRCEVRFRAEAGQLEIVVSGAGRADWRTTWPLPAS